MPEVLIDALTLGDPDSANRGFGRYVKAMVDSLPDQPGMRVSALAVDGTVLPENVTERRITRYPEPQRLQWTQHVARLGLDIRRARPDVFHSPRTEPPLFCPVPWVQTLHDLIGLLYPHDLFRTERRQWRVRAPLMRRADAVIAISQFTADLGIRHLGLASDRIHVIHHGVTPIFRQPDLVVPDPDPPFLLYVSEYAAHKGYDEAFEVAARVADAGLPHVLKVVGSFNADNRPIVDAIHHRSRRPERVELLGFVPDEELVVLYRQAAALLVTSRQEGFGRPPIEAMACGTPVITFNNTALPEIVGEGGLLAPDGDVDAIANRALELLGDDELRQHLSVLALQRSAAFDWERCAAAHAELFTSVA